MSPVSRPPPNNEAMQSPAAIVFFAAFILIFTQFSLGFREEVGERQR